jgi:hypothetical protein
VSGFDATWFAALSPFVRRPTLFRTNRSNFATPMSFYRREPQLQARDLTTRELPTFVFHRSPNVRASCSRVIKGSWYLNESVGLDGFFEDMQHGCQDKDAGTSHLVEDVLAEQCSRANPQPHCCEHSVGRSNGTTLAVHVKKRSV